MLYRNLYLACRRLVKNRLMTSLNFAGLALSLATAMLIGMLVRKEWLTDHYVPDSAIRFIRSETSKIKCF